MVGDHGAHYGTEKGRTGTTTVGGRLTGDGEATGKHHSLSDAT